MSAPNGSVAATCENSCRALYSLLVAGVVTS